MVIFSDETAFSDLKRIFFNGYIKAQFIELKKLAKESIRSMYGQQYQEQKKQNSLNYLLVTWILMHLNKNLKKIFRLF